MSDTTLNGAPLTVVLVHGAFADASSWNGWNACTPRGCRSEERAEATITEVEGSHVIMISQPDTVAGVIVAAAASLHRPTAAAAGLHMESSVLGPTGAAPLSKPIGRTAASTRAIRLTNQGERTWL